MINWNVVKEKLKKGVQELGIFLFFLYSFTYVIYGIYILKDDKENIHQCKNSFLVEYIIFYNIFFLTRVFVIACRKKGNLRRELLYNYNCHLFINMIIELLFAGWGFNQLKSGYCEDGYPEEFWDFVTFTTIMQSIIGVLCILSIITLNCIMFFCYNEQYMGYYRQPSALIL